MRKTKNKRSDQTGGAGKRSSRKHPLEDTKSLREAENYGRFADRILEKPEAEAFDVRPGLGKDVRRDEDTNDVTDAYLVTWFDEICRTFGCSRRELLGLLSNKRYGSRVKLGLDRALQIEERTLSGRRPRRRTEELSDPDASPSAEVNRRDKRVIANIPERLTHKFAEAREANNVPTLKRAFTVAFSEWLDADRPEPDPDDMLLQGGFAAFQVRVDLSTASALENAAKALGIAKRECVQAALVHYVNG